MKAKELIEAVASATQVPTATVRRVVGTLAETVQKQLDAGVAVMVPGLGRFKPKDLPARTRTTKAGETKEMPAGRVVKFKAKPKERVGKKKRAKAAS
jgi:DNA-binding protein HU-beta